MRCGRREGERESLANSGRRSSSLSLLRPSLKIFHSKRHKSKFRCTTPSSWNSGPCGPADRLRGYTVTMPTPPTLFLHLSATTTSPQRTIILPTITIISREYFGVITTPRPPNHIAVPPSPPPRSNSSPCAFALRRPSVHEQYHHVHAPQKTPLVSLHLHAICDLGLFTDDTPCVRGLQGVEGRSKTPLESLHLHAICRLNLLSGDTTCVRGKEGAGRMGTRRTTLSLRVDGGVCTVWFLEINIRVQRL